MLFNKSIKQPQGALINLISYFSIKLNIFLKEMFLSIWGIDCDHLIL